jgi:formyltetrahydrofolate-dependent phosphoribosylglycinamide formyltransferase
MMRVAVLASGGGTNLQALLDTCQGSAPARVVVVISNKAMAGALERARTAGVAAEVLDDPSDGAKIVALLRSYDTELVVLAGYLKLVPEVVVEAYENRMLNIHPALLPSFGGPGMYGHHVHEAVLASGATVSGPTVHIVTAEYDRGPIVAQWPVPVSADDTPETLAARVLKVEHQLLPAVVLAAARAGHVVRLVGKEAAFAGDATPGSVADATVSA